MGNREKRPSSRSRFKRIVFRLLAIILGLIIIFGGLEIGLRLARKRITCEPVAPDTDVVIWCVGDSHTKGLEAPPNLNYPQQLETMLNNEDPEHLYQVNNLSMSGYNSSQVVRETIKFLEQEPRGPDVIIFCAGINNKDNFKWASFLPQDLQNRSIKRQLKYVLANSRAFRLGQLTVKQLQEAIEKSPWNYSRLTDQLLDFSSEAEQEFLRDWLAHDLMILREAALKKGAELALLTYSSHCAWQLQAYQSLHRQYGTPLLDVLYFDHLPEAQRERLMAPGGHPNEKGYYRIAELIMRKRNVFLQHVVPLEASNEEAEPAPAALNPAVAPPPN